MTSPAAPKADQQRQPDVLGLSPSHNIAEFRDKVAARSMLKATSLDSWGLLSLVMDPAIFFALPANTRVNVIGQPAIYAHPILAFPHPGALDPAAVRAVQHIHATQLDDFKTYTTGYAELRGEILELAGDWVVANFLTDPVTGLILDTIPQIMQRLETEYGVQTSAELEVLKASLTVPLSAGDATAVSAYFVARNKTLAKLNRAAQGPPTSDQVLQIIAACGGRGFAHIDAMISHFHATCLTPLQQTPEALTRLIIDRSKNVPAASDLPPPRAFSVVAAASSAPIVKAANPAAAPKKDKAYCYHHGYTGHPGATCRHMMNNPTFTLQQRSAMSPTEVPGGQVGRRGKPRGN